MSPQKELLPLRVLIVDDEAELREILHFILNKMCIQTNTVSSAREALAYIEAHSPDVVISDIKMPDMDGVEFLKTLRANQKLRQPKFLFISGGQDMDEETSLFIQKETQGILAKPFKREEIIRSLKSFLD